jgi:hypothetical protein
MNITLQQLEEKKKDIEEKFNMATKQVEDLQGAILALQGQYKIVNELIEQLKTDEVENIKSEGTE